MNWFGRRSGLLVAGILGVGVGLASARLTSSNAPNRAAGATSGVLPVSEGESVVPPPASEPADAASSEARHEALIARAEAESRDESWAPGAAASLASDLQSLRSKVKFDVRRVECKTTTCLAEIEWENYAAARQSYTLLVIQAYSLNCVRDMYLPMPADPSLRYRARLVLDCASLRQPVDD